MSPAEIAAVIATAEKPKQAKVRSRLYGYCIEKGQPIQLVEKECSIIRQVFEAVATPSSLTGTEILAQLAEDFKKKVFATAPISAFRWLDYGAWFSVEFTPESNVHHPAGSGSKISHPSSARASTGRRDESWSNSQKNRSLFLASPKLNA